MIGVLVFVTKAVQPACMFINRLLDALREGKSEKITVSHEMRKDVKWFLACVKQFNGVTTYIHHPLSQYERVELDASLKGLGVKITLMFTVFIYNR